MVERGNRPATAEALAIAVEEERLVAALREAVTEAEARGRSTKSNRTLRKRGDKPHRDREGAVTA